MRRLMRLAGCGLFVVAGLGRGVYGQQEEPRPEVTLSDREIGRLDIFEDRALSEADAAFNRQEYVAARTGYDEFLKKFPDSSAAAYALLRKGRCAELGGQRSEAVADYQRVVGRFPKLAKYAVPALFRVAECHLAGGAGDDAVDAWSQLAGNVDYRRSPLAAEATTRLIDTVAKEGDPDDVLRLYERLGLDWRSSEDDAARRAIQATVRQHVRTAPDEAKLRNFYKQLEKAAGEHPEKSIAYWNWVVEQVLKNGSFGYAEREARQKYHDYWLGATRGKFPESDDFQIAVAKMHYGADGDRDKLAERLDALFKKKQEKGDWRRILKWVRAYKGDWTKTREYTAKLNYETAGIEGIGRAMDVLCNEQRESYLAKSTFGKFCEGVPLDKLSNDEIRKLISIAWETLGDSSTAQSLAGKLHFEKMSEAEKLALAREFLKTDGAIARKVYEQLEDANAGKLELFEHYVKRGDTAGAVALAGELARVKEYAKQFSAKKAELLLGARRYSEAVTALRECGDSPDVLWQIVDCYVAMQQPEKAIEQLRAVAAAHPGQAAKATYRVAGLYGEAKEKEKQVAVLREIVREHPGSKEAKKAEEELGDLGIPPALPTEPSLDF